MNRAVIHYYSLLTLCLLLVASVALADNNNDKAQDGIQERNQAERGGRHPHDVLVDEILDKMRVDAGSAAEEARRVRELWTRQLRASDRAAAE